MCSCAITEAGKLLLLQANLVPKVEPPKGETISTQVYRDSLVHSKRDVDCTTTKAV